MVCVSLESRSTRQSAASSQRGSPALPADFGARGILQCRGFEHFPDNTDVDWLFDRSGGKGQLPAQWPVPKPTATFVGYSGGLGSETVADALNAITRQHPESVPFWIDMEGAIRTDDGFDISKCRRVCEIVFG